jgi:hypothetical protein
VIDSLQSGWHAFLNLISGVIIPDWAALIGLLPVFLFFGVIMPIITLVVLAWFVYAVRRPHAHLTLVDGPREAQLDAAGSPVYPAGEPFCTRDHLVYASGRVACDACHQALSVVCPKCGVGRSASISTCGNCGLVLRLVPRARILRPAGPPKGGAAAA